MKKLLLIIAFAISSCLSQQQNTLFEDLKKLDNPNIPLAQQIDLLMNDYKGDNYLSKEEAISITNSINESLNITNQKHLFLLYFYSTSVPTKQIMNFLLDVDILQKNGINIHTKQYTVGYSNDFEQYMMKWKEEIKSLPVKHSTSIKNTFALKMDPYFFRVYDVKRVPAIAFATCATFIPDVKECKIHYMMHGDMPLVTFFDAIVFEEKDTTITKAFKEFSKVLIANQIYKPNILNISTEE